MRSHWSLRCTRYTPCPPRCIHTHFGCGLSLSIRVYHWSREGMVLFAAAVDMGCKRNNGYYVAVCFKSLNHDQQWDGPLTLTGTHQRGFMIIQPALNITAPELRNQYRGFMVWRGVNQGHDLVYRPVMNKSCPRRPPKCSGSTIFSVLFFFFQEHCHDSVPTIGW